MKLKAPFTYFGGKSKVAGLVWDRLGDVKNYVEPFFGSGAVLLARPHEPRVETVNDLDGLLCNFWRAVQAAPDAVAEAADWPVSECDLHARHLVLVDKRNGLTDRLIADPSYFDAELAGWWVWGACSWIGSGWCSGEGPWHIEDGVFTKGNAGRGISRQLPHLGDAGRGIKEWFAALCDRLRRVRIACGDWSRVLGDSATWRHGLTGVFLDPPYTKGAVDYSVGGAGGELARAVAAWALEAGKRPDMRIALAGHAGEHSMPGWAEVPWKGRGGYGNQGGADADDMRHQEVIWFSPACLTAPEESLPSSQATVPQSQ
jgi:hypothetical protein